jgi:hypothetical protein
VVIVSPERLLLTSPSLPSLVPNRFELRRISFLHSVMDCVSTRQLHQTASIVYSSDITLDLHRILLPAVIENLFSGRNAKPHPKPRSCDHTPQTENRQKPNRKKTHPDHQRDPMTRSQPLPLRVHRTIRRIREDRMGVVVPDGIPIRATTKKSIGISKASAS